MQLFLEEITNDITTLYHLTKIEFHTTQDGPHVLESMGDQFTKARSGTKLYKMLLFHLHYSWLCSSDSAGYWNKGKDEDGIMKWSKLE
jgi:hypothetical protein